MEGLVILYDNVLYVSYTCMLVFAIPTSLLSNRTSSPGHADYLPTSCWYVAQKLSYGATTSSRGLARAMTGLEVDSAKSAIDPARITFTNPRERDVH